MFKHGRSWEMSLAILLVLFLALALPGPTRLAAGQAVPGAAELRSQLAPATTQSSAQPEPLFQVVTPGSGLANPGVDARRLLDARRAIGAGPGSTAGQQAARPRSPAGAASSMEQQDTGIDLPNQGPTPPAALKGMSIRALDPGSGSSAPDGAGSTLPRSSGTRPEPQLSTPQQSVATCAPMLYNSPLTDGTGWYVYGGTTYISGDAYYSPPHSLRMVEWDGDSNDMFGQTFVFPAGANSLAIDYKIAYAPGYTGVDYVGYALYLVNADGTLGNWIVYWNPPTYSDGQWHSRYGTFGYDPAVFPYLQGQWVALIYYTSTDDAYEYLDVYFDDISMTTCDTASVPMGTISGQYLGSTAPFTDTLAVLTYQPAGGDLEVTGVEFPDYYGAYQFRHVGALGWGEQYQVWYLNDSTRPDRLSLWAGPIIGTFADGQNLTGISFDLKNLTLTSPVHETQTPFPVVFTWASRGVSGDRYSLCIYDVQTLDEVCTTNPLTSPAVMVNAADLQNIAGFDFQYGRRYAWYIRVLGPSYVPSAFAHVGFSYYAHAVTFLAGSVPTPVPSPTPTPSAPIPTPAPSGQDWTVMVYIAGDNNLGDPNRYTNPTANLQGQWATLKQLAKSYPKVNLLTLTDFYDNSGTQFCHQLSEKDTSDPAVLAKFVNDTLASFVANRTMLIISDHGHTIAGVASDETTSRTATMTPDKVRQAFESASLRSRKLDILFYNVCLMGSFEVAFDASPYANFLIASSNEVWVLSVYERLFPLLAGASKNNPPAVAVGIVTAYKQTIDASAPGLFVSSAAYDLSRVSAVNTALSALATALSNNLALSRTAIATVRGQVQVYDSSGNITLGSEDAFVDLRHLATLLSGSSGNQTISNAANQLLTALGTVGGPSALVMASYQVTGGNGQGGTVNLANGSGLSVYFPNGNNTGGQPTLTNLYLNTSTYQPYTDATQWDEFVRVYVSGGVSGGPHAIESGVRPIDGALPSLVYVPAVMKRR
jgi:hypothetical protein